MVVKNDHKALWIALILVLIVALLSGAIFLYWDKITEYFNPTDSKLELSVSIVGAESIKVLNNAKDSDAIKSDKYTTFTVTGSYRNPEEILYNLYFTNKSIDPDLKVYLTDENGNALINSVSIKYFSYYQELNNNRLLYQDKYNFIAGESFSRTYKIIVWSNKSVKQDDLKLAVNTNSLFDLDSCYIIEDSAIIGYKCYKGNNYDMPVVTDLVIPNSISGISIRAIAPDAFYDRNKGIGYGIRSVVISDGIAIGNDAFNNNELEYVMLPNDIKFISDRSFCNNKIVAVTIPDSVYQIGDEAFASNVIIDLDIPSSVEIIKHKAFYNNSLTNVVIHGKTSFEGFQEFDYESFGFMIGYNIDKNVTFD